MNRRLFVLALTGALTTLGACSHGEMTAVKPESDPDASSRRMVWAAMGTVWTLDYLAPPEFPFSATAEVEESVREVVYRYDMVFSDWAEDSELRRIERRGLTRWQEPSGLFLEGLRYAKDAWDATGGAFDITIGAVQWKAARRSVGMDKVRIQGQRFRFVKDPRRLTFGGIAKGMAVGAVAMELLSRGVRDFRIDAGGGNLALVGFADGKSDSWPEAQTYKLRDGKVWHVSRSSAKAHRDSPDDFDPNGKEVATQHIWDPKDVTRALHARDVVICGAAAKESQQRAGAFADVYSKAVLIRGTFRVPKECFVRR